MSSTNRLPVFQPGQICSPQLDFLPFSNTDSFHLHKSERSHSHSLFSGSSALFSSGVGPVPLERPPSFIPSKDAASSSLSLSPIRNHSHDQPSSTTYPYPSLSLAGPGFKQTTSLVSRSSPPQMVAVESFGGILDSPYVVKHQSLRLQAPPSPPPTIPTPTQDLPSASSSPWLLDDIRMEEDIDEDNDSNDNHDTASSIGVATTVSTLSTSSLIPTELPSKSRGCNDSNALLSPLVSSWEATGISDLDVSPTSSPMLTYGPSGSAASAITFSDKDCVLLAAPAITFSGWEVSPLSGPQGHGRLRSGSPPLSITILGKPSGTGTAMQFRPDCHHLRIDLTTPHVYHISAPTQPSLLVYKPEDSTPTHTASTSPSSQSPTSPLSPVSPTTPPDDEQMHYHHQDDDRFVIAKDREDSGTATGSTLRDSDNDSHGASSALGGRLFDTPSSPLVPDVQGVTVTRDNIMRDNGHSMPPPQLFMSLFHRPPLDFDEDEAYECPSSPASLGHLHSPLPPEDEDIGENDDATILSEGLTNEPISLLNWDNFGDDGPDTLLSLRSASHDPNWETSPSAAASDPISSPGLALKALPSAETDDQLELTPLTLPMSGSPHTGSRPLLSRSHSDPEKKDNQFLFPSTSFFTSLRSLSYPLTPPLDSSQFEGLGLDLGTSDTARRHNRGSSSSQNPPRSPSPEDYYLDPSIIAEHATDQPELDRLYEIRMKAQEAEREARKLESLATATAARARSSSGSGGGSPNMYGDGTSTSYPNNYRGQSGWSAAGLGVGIGWNGGSGDSPGASGSGLGLSGIGMDPSAVARCAQEAGRVRKREKEKCREVSTFLRLKLSERGVFVGPQPAPSSGSGGEEGKGKSRAVEGAESGRGLSAIAPKALSPSLSPPPAPHSTPYQPSTPPKKAYTPISTMEQLVARMLLRRSEMQMQRSPGSSNLGLSPGANASASSPSGGGTSSGVGGMNSNSNGEKKSGPVRSPLRQCVLPEDLETDDEDNSTLDRDEQDKLLRGAEIVEEKMDIDDDGLRTTSSPGLESSWKSESPPPAHNTKRYSPSSLLSPLSSTSPSALSSSANILRFSSDPSPPSNSSTLTALHFPSSSLLNPDLRDVEMSDVHGDGHRVNGPAPALLLDADPDFEAGPDSLNLSLFGF